jgi:hypothetical protein
MKQFLLSLAFLFFAAAAFSQTTTVTPKPDTTKVWTIHGQNTFLINQSSFYHWSAGGINALAADLVLDYDFDYKKGKWSWDNKAIAAYGLSKTQDIGWRKTDDRLILNSQLSNAVYQWLFLRCQQQLHPVIRTVCPCLPNFRAGLRIQEIG